MIKDCGREYGVHGPAGILHTPGKELLSSPQDLKELEIPTGSHYIIIREIVFIITVPFLSLVPSRL
jgi:hypothetical protein